MARKNSPWGIKRHLFAIMGTGLGVFLLILFAELMMIGSLPQSSLGFWASVWFILISAREKIIIEPSFMTNITQSAVLALGVLTGAGAAVLAYRKHRNEEEKHEQEKAADYTSRFLQAAQLLGSGNTYTRISGAHVFDRIARDSAADRQRVMDVLCSLFRESRRYTVKIANDKPSEPDKKPQLQQLEAMQDTVLKIIAKLNNDYIGLNIDLSGIDLSHVEFGLDNETMSLRNVEFRGAHFEGAYLLGAHLEGADLGRTHLEGAELSNVHLEGADLCMAYLEDAHLGYTHLEGAYLRGAHLEGADLEDAHLEGAYLAGTHLKSTNLIDANLEGADLTYSTYGINILQAIWNEETIFSNGQKGTPDISADDPPSKLTGVA